MLNMFNMLGIRLEPELEVKLDSLAKETGRSKNYYARKAIRQYLEDREDYLKGIAALERREPTKISGESETMGQASARRQTGTLAISCW